MDNSLSRQAEGSGIGFYLVKMFVEKMGGSISVTSTLYNGSVFLVRLPDTQDKCFNCGNDCEEVDNKRIIRTMNIEFSDIYFSK